MKISAKDIYNVNRGSLKDAIVSCGGFSTSEIVSEQAPSYQSPLRFLMRYKIFSRLIIII